MVLTLEDVENGATLAPSGATIMSEEEVVGDVRDFFGRNAEFVEKCGWSDAAAADATKRFVELHRYYYQGKEAPWAGGKRADRLGQFGPPRPWTGRDVLNCLDACGLGADLQRKLEEEEIYVAENLTQESPVTWLDTEDLVDLLGDDLAGDDAVFLLAVNYIKGSNRSSSRKA